MKTKNELINWLRGHELMKEGRRNDDAVNLAILTTMYHGLPRDEFQLVNRAASTVSHYGLRFHDPYDRKDYKDRMHRIFPYLEEWNERDIIQYAID